MSSDDPVEAGQDVLVPRTAFLVGTGRCGSTLAHELLCAHERVGFVSNVDDNLPTPAWLDRVTGPVFRGLPPAASRKGRLRFAPSEAWQVLDREVSPILSHPPRDLVAADATPWLRARTRSFFLDRARRQGADVFVHKFTGWPRSGFVDACLDEPRFVHVVRDGRAVVNSWLQMDWWQGYRGPGQWQWGPLDQADQATWDDSGQSFPVLGALLWRRLIHATETARAAIEPQRWLTVRHEDLVADPLAALEQIVGFLDLEATQGFRERVSARPVRQGRLEAWHDDLGHDVSEAITQVMSDQLRLYDYG